MQASVCAMRHALLHAAGKLARIAVLETLEMHEAHVLVDDPLALGARHALLDAARTRCCRATVSQGNSE